MNNFFNDLARGIYYEKKAINIMSKYGFSDLKRVEGYKKEYDITGTYHNKPVYIESKYNKYTSYTNKIFIECFNTKYEPSGITATESTYYILFSYFDSCFLPTILTPNTSFSVFVPLMIPSINPLPLSR